MTAQSAKSVPLKRKFLLYSATVMAVFSLALSLAYYYQTRRQVMAEALRKSEIILQQAEAIREYVKDVMRPLAYDLAGRDQLVIELMSTTYVSNRIMQGFQERIPLYSYRRVSQNPRNPDNLATAEDDRMLDWFAQDPQRSLWQGMVELRGEPVFVSAVPDYITPECLVCHGRPEDAPRQLIERYGDYAGFRFSDGDLAGMSSVSIPVSAPLANLRTRALTMFLAIFIGSLLLLLILNLLFTRLVVDRVTEVMRTIGEGDDTSPAEPAMEAGADEIDTLQESFRHLTAYLRVARKGQQAMPNFIGSYVVGAPFAAGTLSWVLHGRHSVSAQPVSLKFPFSNIQHNPIYRSCYQHELAILRNCSHPSLLEVRESVEPVLVCQPLTNYILVANGQLLAAPYKPTLYFTAIFDLVAYLHTQAIVHHDLRPENFAVAKDSRPMLLDLGVAYSRELPDVIYEGQLGPQGDPLYMAPEQMRGERGDSRSDIYSLGVWLWQIFAGSAPFPDQLSFTKLQKVKEKSAPPVPAHLQATEESMTILRKALAPSPTDRFQWVEDFRDEILPHLSHLRRPTTPDADGDNQ